MSARKMARLEKIVRAQEEGEVTEKNDRATMRNWSLKTIAGFLVHLEKIGAACPEATEEIYRASWNLKEMDRKIREAQPVYVREREVKEKHRRIFVR